MMNRPMIKVEGISKRYRIGATEAPYRTFRESLMSGLAAPVRNLVNLRSLTNFRDGDEKDVIWALKDVSFEVSEGEVLGIIGRNGAGKSTILKILSRITEPTTGTVDLYGRVSSLLEVGTGFHPELTGRENIFLNGSILGMTKAEIGKKFDEIVAFSEIGKYIDTPVKRYSSGMQVRLAFAVAAHLEPEILLIDEVLAVGDIAFQKKCLGKMEDVAKGGRTVLFVSHNMGAVRSLCQTVVWIDGGEVVKKGEAEDIITAYEEAQYHESSDSSSVVERNTEAVKNKPFYIKRIEMGGVKKRHDSLSWDDTISVTVEVEGTPEYNNYGISCQIYNELGHLVSVCASGAYQGIYFDHEVKKVAIDIGPLGLTSGKYTMRFLCWYGEGVSGICVDDWEGACSFRVTDCQPFRPGYNITTAKGGVFIMPQSFRAIG